MAVLTLTKIKERTAVSYKLIQSVCKTAGCEGEIVYGLQSNIFGEYNNTAMQDISANKREVEELIKRLNKGNVTPDQLIYIVEDYLAEISFK